MINNNYRFKPKKSLGQNFLVDLGVAERIIEALALKPDDLVLEIGPGKGILTELILPKVKKLVAIEKDDDLAKELPAHFPNQTNFKLIHADFLDWDSDDLVAEKLKIVGNLPYNQSKPILRKLLESQLKPELIVLMFQKEVAERLINPVKNNLFSLMVSVFAKVEKVMIVSRDAFSPRPKVDSTIIKLIPYQKPLVSRTDQPQFFALIKKAFRFPRKKLLNNLPELSETDLTKIGLDQNIRAEDLKLEQWIMLLKSVR